MRGKITIENHTGDTISIDIEGVIGVPEQMQFQEAGDRVSTYSTLRNLLERVSGQSPRSIEVNIRSTGGSVSDALLIYDFLKSCGADVTTRCYGYAASAATIIAQAASAGKREVSANCLYLVHNSSCETQGSRLEMESAAGLLRQTDERIAGIYSINSGRDASEFTALMGENGGRGRWLSPEEVTGYGLADIIVGGSRVGRKDVRLLKNLSLPPLPGKNSLAERLINKGKNIIGTFREAMDTGSSPVITEEFPEGETVTTEQIHDKTVVGEAVIEKEAAPQPCPVKNRAGIAEPDPRKTVSPSVTKPKEDPSVYGQRLSQNEEAYLEDLRKIRKV